MGLVPAGAEYQHRALKATPHRLIRLDRVPGLEGATCRRTWWPDDTVNENVVLAPGNNGRELTDDELDRWVASFPIEEQEDGIRPVPLPPPSIPVETL